MDNKIAKRACFAGDDCFSDVAQRAEYLRTKGSASMLSNDVNMRDDNDEMMQEDVPMEEQRRRRIYQSQFNRPYPKKRSKKILLWQEEAHQQQQQQPLDRTQTRSSQSSRSRQQRQKSSQRVAPQMERSSSAEDVIMTPERRTKDEIMTPVKGLPRVATPESGISLSGARQVTPPSGSEDVPEEVVSLGEHSNFSALSNPKGADRARKSKSKGSPIVIQPVLEPDDTPHFESHTKLNDFMKQNEDHTLKLYIDDYQDGTFDRIVESLYGNTKLHTLSICRAYAPTSGNFKTPVEVRFLLQAIRCLPYLKTFQILNARPDLLNDVVENLPRKLTKFQLHMAGGAVSNELLDALAQHPSLTQVQLESAQSFEAGRVLSSSSITNLRVAVNTARLERAHLHSFVQNLSQNQNLVVLDLEPTLDVVNFRELLSALKLSTTLQTLIVDFDVVSDTECEQAMVDLSDFVKANKSVTKIKNHKRAVLTVASGPALEALLTAMSANCQLQEFHFFVEEPMFWVAKESILQHNRTDEGASNFFSKVLHDYLRCPVSLRDVHDIGDICSKKFTKTK